MNYLYLKLDHYINIVMESGTDRLYKGLKVATNSKSGKLIREIFNVPIDTEYKVEKYDSPLLISFLSNSLQKYRIDIFVINELERGLINHISFSLYDNDLSNVDDYESNTNRGEMIEVINRIHFILKDLLEKEIIRSKFCIGGTELIKKNKIYEYLLKVILINPPIKRKTDLYDTKFGLYFDV
jgi:hypothetical protein